MIQPNSSLQNCTSTLAALLALLFSAIAIAETVYVTDELRLGLYQGEQTSGRPFKTLTSGDALEILERSLMSIQVRTESGEVGWVKTAYIVSEEPGRRRAKRLEAQNTQLEAGLEAAKAEISNGQLQIDELNRNLTEANAGIEELPAVQAANAELQQELAQSGSLIPASWAIIAGALALLGGFAAGYLWLDRKVRRQFGGVRVY
jgi:hypothetical protein